ncbi:unnamed protein product, partial [Symbiodinium necroappetens]
HFREGARHRSLHLESILGLMQRTLLRDALSLGAGISMIMLECQKEEILEAVRKHLRDLKNNQGHLDDLSIESGDVQGTGNQDKQLYLRLRKDLRDEFPDVYKSHKSTGDKKIRSEEGHWWEETEWTRLGIQITSSVVTAVLVLLLQVEESAAFYLKPCEGCVNRVDILGREEPIMTSWTFWMVTCYVVCVTTYTWYCFVEHVLNITFVQMRENRDQLLLFTALTRAGAFNSLWSKANLKRLYHILSTKYGAKQEERALEERALRKFLAQRLRGSGEACLDLQRLDHAEAWWKLRMYIQIDFLDETALVEIVGMIIFMLTVLFAVVGLLDWLKYHTFSLPLSLLALLIWTLVIAMYRVFEECEAINSLWENDNRALSLAILRATHAACTSPHPDPKLNQHASFLRAMQNKVAVFENRQELFGWAVTRNLRNGWVATMATLVVTSAVQIAKPVILNGLLRGQLQGLLDLDDDMFNNASTE